MERWWIIVAGLCAVVAPVFAFGGNLDAAFVTATLGVVGWFFSLRDRLRRAAASADDKSKDAYDDKEDERDE